jgi:hypothetical protein
LHGNVRKAAFFYEATGIISYDDFYFYIKGVWNSQMIMVLGLIVI